MADPNETFAPPDPATIVHRRPGCVEAWPECSTFDYDPRCCRWPKSCSADLTEPLQVFLAQAAARAASNRSPERCAQRIENAIGIIGLRIRPNGMDLVPQAKSTDLMKMILLDAASLLDHFHAEEADRD